MSEERWAWSRDHRFRSDTTAGKQVVEEVLKQLEANGWPEHDVFGIHLAVEEALVNAIKHGNQSDSEKFVDVELRISSGKFHMRITDEGDGFDPSEVPDPTLEENLEVPSGRGLMLMRTFMSRIEFNDRGNSVLLFKDLNAPEE